MEAAHRAIHDHLARPLGMTLEQAAWGVHAMVNLQMELATRVVSIERGHDPRQLAVVATGGCGPTHACRLVAHVALSLASHGCVDRVADRRRHLHLIAR